MADGSGIEWTEATWNPLVGCTKVSPGCDNCYAEKVVNRWHAAENPSFPVPFDVVHVRQDRPHLYDQPLRWFRPRRIFVNSLSDLFHKDVPNSTIVDVFAIMACAPRHTFQLLTKRHGRMRSLLNRESFADAVAVRALERMGGTGCVPWPLPHLWLGVSVENQQWADIRIPELLATPAVVRWISAEPLLGPLDLSSYLDVVWDESACGDPDHCSPLVRDAALDWVVAGGESGAGARPMHPNWGTSLRDQCAAAGVPFLWKQWGSWAPLAEGDALRKGDVYVDPATGATEDALTSLPRSGPVIRRMSKRAAGRRLDGRRHDGYPQRANPVYS